MFEGGRAEVLMRDECEQCAEKGSFVVLVLDMMEWMLATKVR
jgi:hypothetical protein